MLKAADNEALWETIFGVFRVFGDYKKCVEVKVILGNIR